MESSFYALLERSVPPMELFWKNTLSRLMLSYIPMLDYLSKLDESPKSIASFGSGSCAHEVFLASAFPDAAVNCHDITDAYIPNYLRNAVLEDQNNVSFFNVDLEKGDEMLRRKKYELVFSIQTLEHIENYRGFLEQLVESVSPGGYLYLDAPYYHMDDSRENTEQLNAARDRQWQQNEHYYLGFSPSVLISDSILSDFSVLHQGYYCFGKYDLQLQRLFRGAEFGNCKGTKAYCESLGNLMKILLDTYDGQPNLDDFGYFQKPASAFRLLLQKGK